MTVTADELLELGVVEEERAAELASWLNEPSVLRALEPDLTWDDVGTPFARQRHDRFMRVHHHPTSTIARLFQLVRDELEGMADTIKGKKAGVLYLNAGDPYNPTLIYSVTNKTFHVGCMADWEEYL